MNTGNDDTSDTLNSRDISPQRGDSEPQTPPDPATERSASQPAPTTAPSPSSTPTVGRFLAGIDERCLWVDPLANDPRVKAGAVLLGDIIDHYVRNFNVLIDSETSYDVGKLKGGSYTMTPDENDACTFVFNGPGEVEKKELRKDRDLNGQYYVVPCNSLVYIKLKQRLRLPFYLIGRHNLKIRYVYKGLLLGTGPQVDPGFEGNLFIPLHNFTTSDARVYITGKQNSFVSIDFVRTTPFSDNLDIPAHLRTVNELRCYLETLGNPRVLIEEDKIKRRTVEDYLDGDKPRSQLAQFQSTYQRFEEATREEVRKLERWARIERIALFITVGSLSIATAGVLITTINCFRGFASDLKTETREVKQLVAAVKSDELEQRLSLVASNSILSLTRVQDKISFLASSSSQAASNVAELENRLKRVEKRLTQFRSNSTKSTLTNAAKPES